MKKTFIFILFFISTDVLGYAPMEDFSSNPENRWQFFTDQVMGGQSYGKLEFLTDKNGNFARMSGDVSIANNGGFIQFRGQLGNQLNNSIRGIRLKVRGNNQKYFVHLRTTESVSPRQYYQKEFFASNKWTEVKLLLSDFQKRMNFMKSKIKPSSIRTVGIVAYGRNHQAELEVHMVSFY